MKKRWFYRRARVISAEFARLALVGSQFWLSAVRFGRKP
jgi:hypothetical protein